MSQTILVAASSASLRQTLRLALERAQHQVFEASDGQEALARLKAQPEVSVLLVELELTQLNGLQLAQQVRRLPQYAFLPIVVMSVQDSQAHEVEGLAAGVTGWLRQPVQTDQLLTVINRLLA